MNIQISRATLIPAWDRANAWMFTLKPGDDSSFHLSFDGSDGKLWHNAATEIHVVDMILKTIVHFTIL